MRWVASVLWYSILFGRIRPIIVNLVLFFTLGVLVCHLDRTIVLTHSRRSRTWLGPVKTLLRALEVMRQNGAGSYFIFFHQTGHKTMYQVDEHGCVRPVEAESQDAREQVRW